MKKMKLWRGWTIVDERGNSLGCASHYEPCKEGRSKILPNERLARVDVREVKVRTMGKVVKSHRHRWDSWEKSKLAPEHDVSFCLLCREARYRTRRKA